MHESPERRRRIDIQMGGDRHTGTESLESNRAEAIIWTSQRKTFGHVLGVLYERAIDGIGSIGKL